MLPTLVDEIAAADPERILFSLCKGVRAEDGFDSITAGEFAKAVDTYSWKIEELLGKAQDCPTIAYMGPQDLRYLILCLACQKTGYKVNTSPMSRE